MSKNYFQLILDAKNFKFKDFEFSQQFFKYIYTFYCASDHQIISPEYKVYSSNHIIPSFSPEISRDPFREQSNNNPWNSIEIILKNRTSIRYIFSNLCRSLRVFIQETFYVLHNFFFMDSIWMEIFL